MVPGLGVASFESSQYIRTPTLICLRLFMQTVRCALALALDKTGSNNAARMAMTAMTTSNSVKVKAFFVLTVRMRRMIRQAKQQAEEPIERGRTVDGWK